MQKKDINLISDMAVNKFKFADRAPIKYFFRAIVAGFFLVVAIILSYTTGAVLNNSYPEIARIMVDVYKRQIYTSTSYCPRI